MPSTKDDDRDRDEGWGDDWEPDEPQEYDDEDDQYGDGGGWPEPYDADQEEGE
jgi:hypothetical protein